MLRVVGVQGVLRAVRVRILATLMAVPVMMMPVVSVVVPVAVVALAVVDELGRALVHWSHRGDTTWVVARCHENRPLSSSFAM